LPLKQLHVIGIEPVEVVDLVGLILEEQAA
jgi:hypothetical protein